MEFPCSFYQLRARANPAQEFPVSLPALSWVRETSLFPNRSVAAIRSLHSTRWDVQN